MLNRLFLIFLYSSINNTPSFLKLYPLAAVRKKYSSKITTISHTLEIQAHHLRKPRLLILPPVFLLGHHFLVLQPHESWQLQ